MTTVSWRGLLLVVGIVVGLGACTASKDITKAQRQLRQIEDARQFDMGTVSKPLSQYRKAEEDEVLYHLEHGMLEHFQQDWDQSSRHFRRAQRAIEANYTKSINRNLQSMLVNDLQLPYYGEAYEDVYLNVIKSLNYLHQDDLEGAMVEARKVTHELETLSDRYQGLAESVTRDTAQAAVKKVDEKLADVDLLSSEDEAPVEIQQNSALGRFLTTVLYAKRGEADEARIELQNLRAALKDQGDTAFLAALSDVAATADEVDTPAASPPSEPTTALRLRATPEAGTSVPPLQLRVDGRAVHTVAPTDMGQTDGRYAVKLTDVPATPGDSIAVVPEGTPRRSFRLAVWCDSLQYRGPLAAGPSGATFVLGRPEVPARESAQLQSAVQARPRQADASSLRPVQMTYALTRTTPSGTQQFEARRVLEPVAEGWRVIERIEPALGASAIASRRVDTMRLARGTLHLRRYSHRTAESAPLVAQRDGGAFVEAAPNQDRRPVRTERTEAAHGAGMGVEMALAARTLTVGKRISLPVYVAGQRQVQRIEALVTGTDSVTTPAGRYAVYTVRVQSSHPHQGTTILSVRRAAPHHVVQARTRLPVQRGGRRDTVVLNRSLASLEERKGAVSRPSEPVAASDPSAPPQDPPTVAASPPEAATARSVPSSETLVPAPQQLTAPGAYNTLLVSFSGRAPVKNERSFTFNFTISGEEYELNFAIPVLELTDTEVDRVRAVTAGDTVRVPMIEEMQQVAHALFDEKKSIIYTRAVVRSFLKAAATKGAQKLASNQGGAGAAWLAKQAGQMASGYVAKADTRGWQTMPGFAYATVLNLPSGTQEVTFEYLSDQGAVLKRRTRRVEVAGRRDLALAESMYLE